MRCFSFNLPAKISSSIMSAFIVVVIAVSTFFISVKQPQAEPNPIIGRLMNEPLSMLDYGLWRTEIELRRYFVSMNNIYIAARYHWKKDRINIEVLINELPIELQEMDEKARCESVIESIQNYYAAKNKKNTLFGKSFIHNGYAGIDISQEELFQKLDRMTYINVSVIRNQITRNNGSGVKIDYENFTTCNSPLLKRRPIK